MPACIILLNGFPGVGKLTIAHEIAKILPNCRVFDNHLLIDVAAALFERNDEVYPRFRQELLQTVFRSIKDHVSRAPKGDNNATSQTYVFTESRDTTPEDQEILKEYLNLINGSDIVLVHIVLNCDAQVNITRVASKGRQDQVKKNLKTKLLDVEILRHLRSTTEIKVMFPDGIGRPERLKEFALDVTDLKPADSAKQIVGHVRELVR